MTDQYSPQDKPGAASPDPLTTTCEASGGLSTGRVDEAQRLVQEIEQRFPGRARAIRFGVTPEGRPMMALAVSAQGHLTPEAARASGLPVHLFQGGIHPGEIEGKDAGFRLIRDLLTGRLPRGLLERNIILFIPVFNIDGHERFSAWNRPNQNGPEEMGWRATGQNLNLNRDYTKIDAPEMAQALALINAWDPLFFADLHATDGAQFQHDLSLLVDPADVGPQPLLTAARELRDGLVKHLAAAGFSTVTFYPVFRVEDDPASGFDLSLLSPRYSNGYWGARNRYGVLVETHSWKTYRNRVEMTYQVLRGLLELAAAHGPHYLKAAREADQKAQTLVGTAVPLTYKPTDAAETIAFMGYAYVREHSPVSDATWIRYDTSKPEIWNVPYYGQLVPDVTVVAPKGGYIVSPAFAATVGGKLDLHRIRYEIIKEERPQVRLKTFRAEEAVFEARPFEGRQRLTLTGGWRDERRDVPAGSLFIPAHQPLLRLALYLFEPTSPDSFVAWGLFNAVFERKEYMEAYVAEQVARTMLEDPAVKIAFTERLQHDAAFAADPRARLDFFYQRHPAWDERLNLYPVYRVEDAW